MSVYLQHFGKEVSLVLYPNISKSIHLLQVVEKQRCKWVGDDPLFIEYHDNEYGFKVTNDKLIFERLMLEAFQAGLNWKLILKKRDGFNKAFYNFDLNQVAKMSDKELEELRDNADIVRNKLKIYATRNNARVLLELMEVHGSILKYLQTLPHEVKDDPKNDLKEATKTMKQDGFKFIGPTILDEFFKSIGLNDVNHDSKCFMAD